VPQQAVVGSQPTMHFVYWDIMLTRHLPQRMDDLPSITVGNHEMLIRAIESGDPNFAQAAMRVNMFDSHIV